VNIAIIPARGGSKRIPRKNIRDFGGKPMIVWSIQAAQDSALFERVIVSTDDREIAEVARAHGAEVPFLRPPELADDLTGTTEVIEHATRWLLDQGIEVRAVCCIYATAPFVQPEDIRRGLQVLLAADWSYTFTATEYASPIFRSFCIHPEGGVEMFFPEHFDTRSQELPRALHDAGQFYWGRPEAWLERRRLFERHSCPILIPLWRVHDIDTEEDWRRAELMWQTIAIEAERSFKKNKSHAPRRLPC
jgi:pseudaminic acid cytidylyltransferase